MECWVPVHHADLERAHKDDPQGERP